VSAFAIAPVPAYRLIPSQFPPIGLFDTVATTADLEAVLELVGWTNDRLVAERVRRLPESQWPLGVANASVIMASFLHVAPTGMRFNGPELGAWYAGDAVRTSVAEVAHHLRREAVATSTDRMSRKYRCYTSTLLGDYRDIRDMAANYPEVYASSDYTASQAFGEQVRARGEAGIVYDSLRYRGGGCVVAYVPKNIANVLQTDHYEITVTAQSRRIEVTKLS
jgi:hypothetical protein